MQRNFSVKINKMKVKNKKSLGIMSLMTSAKNLPSGETLGTLLQMQNQLISQKNFIWKKTSEEKTKSLLKKYQKPENCNKMRVLQCNLEIWKINLSSFQHSTDINLQKILLHLMKASYAIVNACDDLILAEETEGSNKFRAQQI